MHYLGPRMKALLYMFGDIVMFVGRLDRALLVLGNGHVSWKFGSVSHGLRVGMSGS
jgi:C4-dicarboxylate transporter DctQ subunit